jgi:hypothetical protein
MRTHSGSGDVLKFRLISVSKAHSLWFEVRIRDWYPAAIANTKGSPLDNNTSNDHGLSSEAIPGSTSYHADAQGI